MLSETIYSLRRKSGLSQERLAEKLCVSRQAISKQEGGLATPELEKLIALSECFGVTLDGIGIALLLCVLTMIAGVLLLLHRKQLQRRTLHENPCPPQPRVDAAGHPVIQRHVRRGGLGLLRHAVGHPHLLLQRARLAKNG